MSEPRIVNPFTIGSTGGPITNFGPIVEVVEVGKEEASEAPTGWTPPPAQEQLPIEELIRQRAIPSLPTVPAEVSSESSSAMGAPSNSSAKSIEPPTDSSTESGPVETSTTESTSLSSTPSTPSVPPSPPKIEKR